MAMEECPRISETTLSGTPLVNMTLAAECRRVCNPAPGIPTRAAASPSGVEAEASSAQVSARPAVVRDLLKSLCAIGRGGREAADVALEFSTGESANASDVDGTEVLLLHQ